MAERFWRETHDGADLFRRWATPDQLSKAPESDLKVLSDLAVNKMRGASWKLIVVSGRSCPRATGCDGDRVARRSGLSLVGEGLAA